ncbi:altered inheritance of mitochondria protein 31, mitochondrial [Rhizodiscina lignyota]|uniref:Altered inheritance of mitochondria protein 31, mitochondrial n=1 Tax=Rhizodiscina lignyota TaxID=1504668 RepID=A0A9P4MAA9_9PEZI|nr:altered inheritance of mitochondria protein 31, mitochondrial [Rhizodiscina lignyota]
MTSPASQPPSSFDDNEGFYNESRPTKLLRRIREEPLIPLGCILTCWALLGATRAIRSGNHNEANRMFRRRIYAQGFTVIAMVLGSVYWQADREKRKELEGIMSETKKKEKHEKWLRELEARDQEEKEMRARLFAGKAAQSGSQGSQGSQGQIRSVVEESEQETTPKPGILQSVKELVYGNR